MVKKKKKKEVINKNRIVTGKERNLCVGFTFMIIRTSLILGFCFLTNSYIPNLIPNLLRKSTKYIFMYMYIYFICMHINEYTDI